MVAARVSPRECSWNAPSLWRSLQVNMIKYSSRQMNTLLVQVSVSTFVFGGSLISYVLTVPRSPLAHIFLQTCRSTFPGLDLFIVSFLFPPMLSIQEYVSQVTLPLSSEVPAAAVRLMSSPGLRGRPQPQEWSEPRYL